MKDGKPFINNNWIEIPEEWTEEERKAHFELASKDPKAAEEQLKDYWRNKGFDVDEMLKEEKVEEPEPVEETVFNPISLYQGTQSPVVRDFFDKTDSLVEEIISEDDTDRLKDLTDLFEVNQRKKNIARINKLSKLLNIADDEMERRLLMLDGEGLDTDQLIKYLDSTQKTMTNMQQTMNQQPLIQVNNQTNEIHIEDGTGFDRESRKKILDTVMAIIEGSQTADDVIEVEGEILDD